MNKNSLAKSQIHDSYHFGITANVTSFLQRCRKERGNVKRPSTAAEYTHTCQMQTNCGRCSLTTWRKHNPTYSTMLRTRRNVTLITSSFKSFHLKTHHLVLFLSTIRADEFKRCNKIFLIQTVINLLLGTGNQITSSSFCLQVCPESHTYRLHVLSNSERQNRCAYIEL